MHVVVVGGGIVGVASAYYLAERGVDVTLFERHSLGSGSTDRAVGGIRAQFSTPVNVRLSVASARVWDEFEARFGTDIERRRTGYLFCTRDDATADALTEQVRLQNDHGVPSELLSPREASEHCRGLRTQEFTRASYSAEDSFADPHLALQGFADAAREAGVTIHTGTAVRDVHGIERHAHSDAAHLTIETDDGSVDAEYVVNAAGAWAPQLAAMAGYSLPIEPHRRQIAVVEPETPVPEDDPLTIDLDTTAHFRPERDGRALVGGHFSKEAPVVDPDHFSETPDLDWTADAIERVGEVADYFGTETRVASGWCGLYAVTPDHHPIIEESLPGVVTAAGFSGHGFQHAPATGQIVTELVCDGGASLVDVSGLGRERFETGETITERNVA
jgi:sarcosine oxidase subunit beta